MGDVIKLYPGSPDKDPEDIIETALGQAVVHVLAKPAFQEAIDRAKEGAPLPNGITIDLDSPDGHWGVIPLRDSSPEEAS